MSEQLSTGSTIGILGGGQLGRMLAMAAARLGYRTHIFEPGSAPAAQVANHRTKAEYSDLEALRAFAENCDIVTFEFENIPTDALDVVSSVSRLWPSRRALEVSQDRLTEKQFLVDLGLRTAPFADAAPSIDEAIAQTGLPAILKTRRFGYDGKGQIRVKTPDEARTAWGDMKDTPAIVEGMVNFSAEISVIAARSPDGAISAFDPGHNLHEDGILSKTIVPAPIPAPVRMDAVLIASKILTALDYVGVMGVELFVTQDGLVVNEIAPRVHNSGHWTQAGCTVDQFEQHIRAIAGWPLGDGTRHANVEMENLIGKDVERVSALANEAGIQVHLYGKSETRAGRKMGHINRVTGSA